MEKKLPVYKLEVSECGDGTCPTETNFISLVETPAIEENFIAFSANSTKKPYQFKIENSAKRMLVGPLMIADLPIYRRNPDTGEEYYVTFDAQAIENCVKNFSKKAYNNNINLEHDAPVDNAYLLESWIVTDPNNDKSKAYGFKNITKGSWFGTVYVPNEELWSEYVKTGKVKGFSVEGTYAQSTQPIEYFTSQATLSKEKEPNLTKEEEEILDYLVNLLGINEK